MRVRCSKSTPEGLATGLADPLIHHKLGETSSRKVGALGNDGARVATDCASSFKVPA